MQGNRVVDPRFDPRSRHVLLESVTVLVDSKRVLVITGHHLVIVGQWENNEVGRNLPIQPLGVSNTSRCKHPEPGQLSTSDRRLQISKPKVASDLPMDIRLLGPMI